MEENGKVVKIDEKEVAVLGEDRNYWWFKAKEDLIRNIIEPGCRVLNIAPGVFDYDGADNWRGDLCEGLPHGNYVYDYVILADVLEHIPKYEREGVLWEINRVLCPGGKLIITVPAYQWLYGLHDAFLGHIDRYSKCQLKHETWMFDIIKIRYWNSILAPFCIFRKLTNTEGSDFKKLPKWLNYLLYKIINLEKYLWFPFGITIVGVFEK